MCLGEIYGSICDDQHLTPFTKHQLKKARAKNENLYRKMKSFNNLLSSQRITIERAFGMLVRKWGIVWRPLAFELAITTLVVEVCAKLHNLSIAYWIKSGKRDEEIHSMYENFHQVTDQFVFSASGDGDDDNNEEVTDAEIAELMSNYITDGERVKNSKKKFDIMENIFNVGIRYNVRDENDFTYFSTSPN